MKDLICRQEALLIVERWMNPDMMRAHAGEMTSQEVRSVKAILRAVGYQIDQLEDASIPSDLGAETPTREPKRPRGRPRKGS